MNLADGLTTGEIPWAGRGQGKKRKTAQCFVISCDFGRFIGLLLADQTFISSITPKSLVFTLRGELGKCLCPTKIFVPGNRSITKAAMRLGGKEAPWYLVGEPNIKQVV